MKLNIEELADKVNELIDKELNNKQGTIKDARQSSVLSTRRIRDYMTKGLLHKPNGTKEKWFDESHVNALVSIRLLQHNGLSEQYIMSSSLKENIENEQQNDALNFLSSLSSLSAQTNNTNYFRNNPIMASSSLSENFGSYSTSSDVLKKDSLLLNNLVQSSKPFTQFNEYCVDKEFGVYLKVDSKMNNSTQLELFEKLQKEIKSLKEKKND